MDKQILRNAGLLGLVGALLLSGCALPSTSVKTGSERPSLIVQGAPADAQLLVDGLSAGEARQYDGSSKVLNVEEGLHQVKVVQGGKTLQAEQIAVSAGETRTITISGANQ